MLIFRVFIHAEGCPIGRACAGLVTTWGSDRRRQTASQERLPGEERQPASRRRSLVVLSPPVEPLVVTW
jgi:hypothetical protein